MMRTSSGKDQLRSIMTRLSGELLEMGEEWVGVAPGGERGLRKGVQHGTPSDNSMAM